MLERFSTNRIRIAGACLALCLVAIGVVLTLPALRWRVHLVGVYLGGDIHDLDFGEMLRFLTPASEQSLERLLDTRNPFAVIRNFRVSPADVHAGGRLFESEGCANCHGANGSGGPAAPSLAGRAFAHGASDWAVFRTIRHGISNTAMTAHVRSDEETWQLVTFVRSLSDADRNDANSLPADVRASAPTPFSDIAKVQAPSADWLTYSGSYSGMRHSALTQINPANVAQLGLRWIHSFKGVSAPIETSPIVRNGVMFVTSPAGEVAALDATDGSPIWTFLHRLPADILPSEVGPVPNRGVAILDDRVFVGTADGKLIALAAASGALLWEVAVSPDPGMYFVSSAPLALRDLVVTGVGTRGGGRGFVVAYEAATGKERWRFAAIPAPGEPGHETWAGDSWLQGGAPTWLTGSYDVESDLLVWGVGNPKPDYDPGVRRGDNLHTNSVVALRGATGALVWHFQFTPGDDHDWDACQIPIIVAGGPGASKRVLWANRNGFYYVFDLLSGKYLTGVPFVRTTWAQGLDSRGLRVVPTGPSRSRDGTVLFPGNGGGTNWWSPTYDAALQRVFVPVLEQGMVFYSSASSWPTASSGTKFYTAVRALNPVTGERLWEHAGQPRLINSFTGGLMSTSSALLFGSDQSTFFALDSRSGETLWSVQTGSNINAAPVTYETDSTRFVAIASGASILSFALPRSRPMEKPATAGR